MDSDLTTIIPYFTTQLSDYRMSAPFDEPFAAPPAIIYNYKRFTKWIKFDLILYTYLFKSLWIFIGQPQTYYFDM